MAHYQRFTLYALLNAALLCGVASYPLVSEAREPTFDDNLANLENQKADAPENEKVDIPESAAIDNNESPKTEEASSDLEMAPPPPKHRLHKPLKVTIPNLAAVHQKRKASSDIVINDIDSDHEHGGGSNEKISASGHGGSTGFFARVASFFDQETEYNFPKARGDAFSWKSSASSAYISSAKQSEEKEEKVEEVANDEAAIKTLEVIIAKGGEDDWLDTTPKQKGRKNKITYVDRKMKKESIAMTVKEPEVRPEIIQPPQEPVVAEYDASQDVLPWLQPDQGLPKAAPKKAVPVKKKEAKMTIPKTQLPKIETPQIAAAAPVAPVVRSVHKPPVPPSVASIPKPAAPVVAPSVASIPKPALEKPKSEPKIEEASARPAEEVYHSMGAIIKRERMRLVSDQKDQQNLKMASIIPEVTPKLMASLSPSAGSDTSSLDSPVLPVDKSASTPPQPKPLVTPLVSPVPPPQPATVPAVTPPPVQPAPAPKPLPPVAAPAPVQPAIAAPAVPPAAPQPAIPPAAVSAPPPVPHPTPAPTPPVTPPAAAIPAPAPALQPPIASPPPVIAAAAPQPVIAPPPATPAPVALPPIAPQAVMAAPPQPVIAQQAVVPAIATPAQPVIAAPPAVAAPPVAPAPVAVAPVAPPPLVVAAAPAVVEAPPAGPPPVAPPIMPAPPPAVVSNPPPPQPYRPVAASAAEKMDDVNDIPQPQDRSSNKQIIDRLPSDLDGDQRGGAKKFTIQHSKDLTGVDPSVEAGKVAQSDSMGVRIETKTPAISSDYELEKAYNALVAGDAETAVGIYKSVLETDPNNTNALFGLATTYHRVGQMALARSYYAKLLAIDPKHRDGLNNFLALLAEDSPRDAIEQLKELGERNPQFSPIPAQIAVIYQKMGDLNSAAENMSHAVELAPENLTYRYNLAIIYDKQQKYDDAAPLYRQIIDASQRGEVIPGNAQKIQQRLTFISSNR